MYNAVYSTLYNYFIQNWQCHTVCILSIKLYRIYVCYTNVMLYIAFGIIHSFT
jgi:hypothetical protein